MVKVTLLVILMPFGILFTVYLEENHIISKIVALMRKMKFKENQLCL
jgi:hypothetical protein